MAHDKLLDIAIRDFGASGLEGASTRAIAAAAGTAMSAITYHFGGKEGLYVAAADRIAERISGQMADVLDCASVLGADDAAAARRAVHSILSRLLDRLAVADAGESLFIMREQMEPTAAFPHIYSGVLGSMLDTMAQLVCAATSIHDAHAARITTLTLMGQVICVRAMRASCLKLLDAPHLEGAPLEALRLRITANTDAILDSLIAEHKDSQ